VPAYAGCLGKEAVKWIAILSILLLPLLVFIRWSKKFKCFTVFQSIRKDMNCFIMAALCNRAGHYIFAVWFLSSSVFLSFFFSSPNLSGRRLDVYHTSAHGVALVRVRMQV